MMIVHGIHKLSDILDKLMEVVIVFMLGAMVVITGAQIVFRIFFTSLAWSEEATRYLLIWSTLLGAGCVYKHAGHISISILQDALPAKAKVWNPVFRQAGKAAFPCHASAHAVCVHLYSHWLRNHGLSCIGCYCLQPDGFVGKGGGVVWRLYCLVHLL